jgi:signal transduction histidine kinase
VPLPSAKRSTLLDAPGSPWRAFHRRVPTALVFTPLWGIPWAILAILPNVLGAAEADRPAAPPTADAVAVERVLVIDQEGPTRPAFVQVMEGIREGLSGAQGVRHDVFVENLDLARLDRTAADPQRAAGWLVEKYTDWSFDIIIPTSAVTRDFVLANRDRLSPGARIVALVRPGERPAIVSPPDIATSVTGQSTIVDTVDLACRLFPDTRRIVLVTQTIPHPSLAARQEAEAREATQQRGLDYEPFIDLPLAELIARLRALPADAAVVYVGYWKDETGRAHVPAEILETFCRASPAPVFGIADTYLGRGVVGGACTDFRALGRAIGGLVVESRGKPLPAPMSVPPVVLFDDSQLSRFGIPHARLPAGSKVLFREPQLWQRYRLQILGGLGLMILQTALIVALVRALRLRSRAERIVSQQRDQIAHAGRVSMLGQLAASLAHELGQPLGAILNNIEAAEILLGSDDSANVAELRAIVADIAADDRRAGAVLDRIRAMVRKQPFTVGPVEIPGLIRDALTLFGPRLSAESIGVSVACDPDLPPVAGDKILLQQALLNLLGNAADAIGAAVEGKADTSSGATGPRGEPGAITIEARRRGDGVELAVSDNGGGIDEAQLSGAIEPFETTKASGLGMGLPIVRAIVEQHDGMIELENSPGQGLTVRLRVPPWQPMDSA